MVIVIGIEMLHLYIDYCSIGMLLEDGILLEVV